MVTKMTKQLRGKYNEKHYFLPPPEFFLTNFISVFLQRCLAVFAVYTNPPLRRFSEKIRESVGERVRPRCAVVAILSISKYRPEGRSLFSPLHPQNRHNRQLPEF